PIADVGHLNVLLDDDSAGKHAVVQPVADAALRGRRVRPSRPVDVSRQVVRFGADNLAERSGVNAAHHFYKGRTVADLESHVQAQFAFGALADFHHFLRAGNVHGDGLFEIDMLAGGDPGFEVWRMKIGTRGEYGSIRLLGSRNLGIRVRR